MTKPRQSAAQREAEELKLRAQRKTGGAAEDNFLERADALLREDRERKAMQRAIVRYVETQEHGQSSSWKAAVDALYKLARKLAKDRRG